MTTPQDISSFNEPIRVEPEEFADRLLDPMTELAIKSASSCSDDSSYLEEKKSMEDSDWKGSNKIADIKRPNNPVVDVEQTDDKLMQEAQSWLSPLLTQPTLDCPPHRYDLNPAELTLALERANAILSRQRYLTSNNTVTTADMALFASLVRIDDVYAPYLEQLPLVSRSFPALVDYCRDIYAMPGVADTVDSHGIRTHFFGQAQPTVHSEFWLLVEGVPPQKRHLLV